MRCPQRGRPGRAAAVVVALLATACPGGDDAPDAGSTSTEAAPPTTTTEPVRGRTVWRPHPDDAADPVAAARSFFADFLGYGDPPGPDAAFSAAGHDAGTVDVPVAFAGWTTTTTVHLARRGGAWEVTEVRTPELSVTEPHTGDTIRRGRLRVSGEARSPDGELHLEVKPLFPGGSTIRLYARNAAVPTDRPGPFSKQLPVTGGLGGSRWWSS